jgi:serine phosphatase RsbU (regulator of sigma subunit)/anti-sigma regulatory factor (Ser/Thr protein kinase)
LSVEACKFFDPEPAAVAPARSFARDTLNSWGVSGAADDAVLLVSELITNAVRHAGTRLMLTLRLDEGTLEAEVVDWHPTRAIPDRPVGSDESSERGRGLLLPSALAEAWGVTYTGTTKSVWFRLTIDGSVHDVARPPGPVAVVPAGSTRQARLPRELGRMDFAELIRHTLEAARDAVGADAAYVLVADEEGELRVRGAIGIAVPAALTALPPAVVLADDGAAGSEVTVPFLVDGRVTGMLGVATAGQGRLGPGEAEMVQAVADRVAMSLERLRLSELERVRRGRVAFLAEASEMLSSTLDQRQAAALAAQLVVPRLGTWCAVFLIGSDREAQLSYLWHLEESRIDALAELLDVISPPVLDGTRNWSLAVPPGIRLSAPAAELARDSAWCFPLTARGRSLGTVVLGRTRGDRRWPDPPSRETMELAEDLTRRVALAIDNARLYERQRTTSYALQRSLLPAELPDIPRADLAAAHEAAGETNEVGGDFYDVFAAEHIWPGTGPGSAGDPVVRRWRFAIGDVCGTGPEAAAVTGLARHALRILAAEGYAIAEVVGRLNNMIVNEGRFITLLHGEISVPPAGPLRVSLVCAGHPLPLLLPASGSRPPWPAAEPQPLLGVMSECSFVSFECELHPGDVLLCVTDGITERRAGDRLLDDDDGLARLVSGWRGLSAAAIVALVRHAAEEFGPDPASDDMAILAIRARLDAEDAGRR